MVLMNFLAFVDNKQYRFHVKLFKRITADISKISKTVQRYSYWESSQDLEGLEIFENPQ